MEYEKIKQLMEDMGKYKLSSIDLELSDGTKISMKKQTEENSTSKGVSVKDLIDREILEKDIFEKTNTNQESNKSTFTEEKKILENQKLIKSPMVGTFYTKPSPTSNPYVEIGSNVKKGEVLCIIEAMKLMNEIESEFEGKIAKILVNDGDMVEYGAPLFIVE